MRSCLKYVHQTATRQNLKKAQTLSLHGLQKVWIKSRCLLLNNIKPVARFALSYSDHP